MCNLPVPGQTETRRHTIRTRCPRRGTLGMIDSLAKTVQRVYYKTLSTVAGSIAAQIFAVAP